MRDEKGRFIKGHVALKGSEKGRFKNVKGKNHPRWKTGKEITSFGYVIVYCPNHPEAHKNKVFEHRLVMEQFLGRFLTEEEVVHHINGNKTDNRIENLMLFSNHSEHMKYERQ